MSPMYVIHAWLLRDCDAWVMRRFYTNWIFRLFICRCKLATKALILLKKKKSISPVECFPYVVPLTSNCIHSTSYIWVNRYHHDSSEINDFVFYLFPIHKEDEVVGRGLAAGRHVSVRFSRVVKRLCPLQSLHWFSASGVRRGRVDLAPPPPPLQQPNKFQVSSLLVTCSFIYR